MQVVKTCSNHFLDTTINSLLTSHNFDSLCLLPFVNDSLYRIYEWQYFSQLRNSNYIPDCMDWNFTPCRSYPSLDKKTKSSTSYTHFRHRFIHSF